MSHHTTWRKVDKQAPCTICSGTGWCLRTTDGRVSLCRRVNTGEGVAKTDKNGDDYWLYFRDSDASHDPSAPTDLPQDTSAERADADTLHKVYTMLLDQLGLTKLHAANLAKRGLSAEAIKRRGYKSMSGKGRAAIARKLADKLGAEALLQVPVFYKKREHGREWVGIAGPEGICVPVRDAEQRIIAIKIRADDAQAGPKFGYLSSTKHGGPSPGAPPHVPLFDGDTAEVRITEGELKADIATELSGTLTVGIAGVSQYRTLLPILRSLGARKAVLAFDHDAEANRHVATALRSTANALVDEGYEVGLEVWPEEAGKGIDDVLAYGFTPETLTGQVAWQTLADIVLNAREVDPPPSNNGTKPDTVGGLPVIQTNDRFLREITGDSLSALHGANKPTFQVFVLGNALARLRQNSFGVTGESLDKSSLKSVLDRSASFMNVTESDGVVTQKPTRPPDDVVADILSLPGYDLPELRSIAGAPVLLPDGRFLIDDGYDAASGIYLCLNGLGGRINHNWPLNRCLDMIFVDLLGGFPFVDEGSRAHALALLLQPFVRPYIDGPTPLHLIDAPARGTGKGLLADVVATVTLGHPAWVMSQPRDEDEIRKRITAILMTGSPMILLDNVSKLDSGTLCAVLTTTQWKDRLLGQSKMVEVPIQATWLATGNNVSLSDEMLRRVVPIRLDAGVERPEDRGNFKHRDLLGWTREHRPELVSAILSIIHYWVVQGEHRGTATLGRFESWAGVMSGILDVADVPGFLPNRGRMYAEADRQTEEWEAFCEAWYEDHGEHPVTAKDLFNIARGKNLLLDVWAGRSLLGAQQRIGRALAARRDRIFGKWAIRSAGRDAHTKNAAYRLTTSLEKNTRNTRNTRRLHRNLSRRRGVSGVFSGPAADPEPPPSDYQKCGNRSWRWESRSDPPSWACGNCEPV